MLRSQDAAMPFGKWPAARARANNRQCYEVILGRTVEERSGTMTFMICAGGVGLFALLTRFCSPAISLAALLILSIVVRAFAG